MKLQDYKKSPSGEIEVKFQLSKDTLDAMLRSMAHMSEQLSNTVRIQPWPTAFLASDMARKSSFDTKFQESNAFLVQLYPIIQLWTYLANWIIELWKGQGSHSEIWIILKFILHNFGK